MAQKPQESIHYLFTREPMTQPGRERRMGRHFGGGLEMRIVPLSTAPGIIVLLTALAGTPALAGVVNLAAATYTTTLCAASCTTATVTVPNSPNASVTIPASIPGDGSSGAGVQGNAGRDPSVFAGANAVGIGVNVSASI
jgi:hypothetical protein